MRPEDVQRIVKPRAGWRVPPNMLGYEATRGSFSWEAAKRELAGLPRGRGLNIAHEAVERHCLAGKGEHPALRWLGRRGEREVFTYAELSSWTSRFANALEALGIGPGERVFSLLGRVPELYIAALGTLKHRAVFCPLFSAFGPEPVRTRLERVVGRTDDVIYIGEGACAVGAIRSLQPDDALVSHYREHGHALARGVPARAIMAEMFGRAEGCSRGRGGSMHLFDVSRRFYGGNAIVAGGLPLALGLALADQLRKLPVIRLATGAGRQVAAQHSHSFEGWFAHIPGIRILAPATLEDARGMLWSALQEPDPVLIFEHAPFPSRITGGSPHSTPVSITSRGGWTSRGEEPARARRAGHEEGRAERGADGGGLAGGVAGHGLPVARRGHRHGSHPGGGCPECASGEEQRHARPPAIVPPGGGLLLGEPVLHPSQAALLGGHVGGGASAHARR